MGKYMKKVKQLQASSNFFISYVLMAAIPIMVCSLFFYPQIRRKITQQASKEAVYQAERAAEDIDRQIQIVNNIPNLLYENQNIRRMDLEQPQENLRVYAEIRNMIATNNNIKDCFLYIRDKTYFISGYEGNIAGDTMEKYRGKIGFCYEDWAFEQVLEDLDQVKKSSWRPAENVILMGKEQKNVMTYISSVPQNNQFAQWTVMVLIDSDELVGKSLERTVEREGYLLYDSDMKLLYRSEGVEEGICEKLQQMGAEQLLEKSSFRWKENTLINAVQSGTAGWILIKVSDLSIMLKQLHELEMKFILIILFLALCLSILGHYFIQMNFRPIQQIRDMLVQAGKKEKRRVVEEYYREIEQAIRILQSDNERMEKNLSQTAPKMKKHMLEEILSGSFSVDKKEIQRELEEIAPEIIAENYCVAVVHLENPEKTALLEKYIVIATQNREGRLLFSGKSENSEVFILTGGECLRDKLKEMMLAEEFENKIQIGIGKTVEELTQLSASFSQAYAALDYAIFNSIVQEPVCYWELPDTVFRGHTYPLELVDTLAFSVRMGKIEETKTSIGQILYMIQLKEVSPYYTRALFYNVVNIFAEKEEIFKRLEKENGGVSALLTKQLSSVQMGEIIKKCYTLFEMESTKKEEKESEWMSHVRLYIEMHAAESSLSLADVSAHIDMSPAWFSTLFKEKSGCSFKEYVDMVRLEKARELLTDTEDTIEAVAEKVGYNSSYSFSRFFKKYTGVTPNTYRIMKRENF